MFRYSRLSDPPNESISLKRSVNEKVGRRKIYRVTDARLSPGLKFGPCYTKVQFLDDYERAWEHVQKNSRSKEDAAIEASIAEEEAKEAYMSAIRRVQKEAHSAYPDEVLQGITDTEFKKMMIRDGCFSLQLALIILGASKKHLMYDEKNPPGMIINNKGKVDQNNAGWILSMFFVGNQIPLVVLKELMKQTFFQKVIQNGRDAKIWKEPKEMHKKILSEELLLPELRRKYSSWFWWKAPTTSKQQKTNNSLDILHSLHIRLVGRDVQPSGLPDKATDQRQMGDSPVHHPLKVLQRGDSVQVQHDDNKVQLPRSDSSIHHPFVVLPRSDSIQVHLDRHFLGTHENNRDQQPSVGETGQEAEYSPLLLEEGVFKEQNIEDKTSTKTFHSAVELEQKGILIKVVGEETGIMGIRFKGNFIRGTLYLPVFHLEKDTEPILEHLILYEKAQKLKKNERDVSSYIKLLRELICTEDDAEIICQTGIISDYEMLEHLPGMLKSLPSMEVTQNIYLVRQEIKRHSHVDFRKYREILSVVFLLTLVQTIFTVLGYIRDSRRN